MVSNGGVTAVSERTRASVTNTRYVVRVSTEDSCFDFGHVTAVLVSDDLPYDLVVLHLSRWSFEIRRRSDGIFGQEGFCELQNSVQRNRRRLA